MKEPSQLPNGGSDRGWTVRAQGLTVNPACQFRRGLSTSNKKNKIIPPRERSGSCLMTTLDSGLARPKNITSGR